MSGLESPDDGASPESNAQMLMSMMKTMMEWIQTQQAFKTLGYTYIFKTNTKTHRNENGVLIATNRFQPESTH